MATKKNTIIYGWLYNWTGHPLWVYQKLNDRGLRIWGTTDKIEEATPFPSVQACKEHYLSKHVHPERFIKSTQNGYLKFLNLSTQQTALF